MITRVVVKVPELSKSWVAVQLPDIPWDTADSSSPKWKMHLKGAVPPVNVAVNVTTCPDKGLLLERTIPVVARAGSEKVKLRVPPAETFWVLPT